MFRHRSHHSTSAASALLFVLAVVLMCGAVASFLPLPRGVVGFAALFLILFGLLDSGRHGRRHGRSSRRYRRTW